MEILEQRPIEYILYKLENGFTFLSVTHKFPNIAIPVEIIHKLNDNDIKEYHTNKEFYLLNQIEQMKNNPQRCSKLALRVDKISREYYYDY